MDSIRQFPVHVHLPPSSGGEHVRTQKRQFEDDFEDMCGRNAEQDIFTNITNSVLQNRLQLAQQMIRVVPRFRYIAN